MTNLWPNRLIGDAALPVEKRLTKTNIAFSRDQPLLGIGPLGSGAHLDGGVKL